MDQFEDNIEDQQDDDTLDTTQDDSQDSADDQSEDTDGSLNETEILLSMIDAAQNNQASDFKNTFDSMLRLKINDKIEALKQDVSASLAGGNLADDQEDSEDIQEEVQMSDEELDEFLEGLSDEELANLQEELQDSEKKKLDEAGFDNIMNSIKADHAASQQKNAASRASERADSAKRLAQSRAKSALTSQTKARELEQKIKSETDSTKKAELQNRLKRVQSNLSEGVKPKYVVKGTNGEYVETRGSRKKAVNVAKRWFKGAKPNITRVPSRPKLEEGSSSPARRERKQRGIEKANNGDPFAGTPSKTKKGKTGGVGKYTGSYRSKMADSQRRWEARKARGQGIPEGYNQKHPGWDRITSDVSDYDKKQAETDAKNVEAKKKQSQKTYSKAHANYMKAQGKNPDGSPIKESCNMESPSQLDWAREQLKKRRNKILKIKSNGPKSNIKEVVSAHSSTVPKRGFQIRAKGHTTANDNSRDSVSPDFAPYKGADHSKIVRFGSKSYINQADPDRPMTSNNKQASDSKIRSAKKSKQVPEPKSASRSYILQRRAERTKKSNIKEMDDSTLMKYRKEAERLRKEKMAQKGKNIKKLVKRGYKFPSDDNEKDSK